MRKKVCAAGIVLILAVVFVPEMAVASETISSEMAEEDEESEIEEPEPQEILVNRISLDESKVILKKGKSRKLKTKIAPADASNQKLQWKSSNPSVASVSDTGKITARKKGTAHITVTAQDGSKKEAVCKVVVRNQFVSSIKLAETAVSLGKGKSAQISVASVSPKSADVRKVTYTSSDEKVAVVSPKGKVTAKKVGTCTITVAAADGSGKKATFHVTVRKYQRDEKYYPITEEIELPGGGYSVSSKNIGLKVIKVNKRLRGSTDARYSSSTKSAVKRFQKKKHLKVTGVVNKKTWLAMGLSKKDWYHLGTYRTPMKVNVKSSKKDYTNAILKTAKAYVKEGTAYRVGCSGKPGTYVDCSGLVYQCLYAAGINPDTNIVDHALAKYEYTSTWLSRDEKLGKTVSAKKKKPGDIVFYCKSRGSVVVHVGIYAGKGKIYDAWPGIGVTKRSISVRGYRVSKIVRVFP